MDVRFNTAGIQLASDLFKEAYTSDKNVLVSPLSMTMALAMAACGAEGETREEIVKVLCGDTGISFEEFCASLSEYVSGIPSSDDVKLRLANSGWFRNDIVLKKEYEAALQSSFDAEIRSGEFCADTVKAINDWVDGCTGGLIPSIVDNLSDESLFYILNALAFDAVWEKEYAVSEVSLCPFTPISGDQKQVPMMSSREDLYIHNDEVIGFIKPYACMNFSFAAIMPCHDLNIEDYIRTLTGAKLVLALAGCERTPVDTMMPRFKTEYAEMMNSILHNLGVKKAFLQEADFSGITDMNLSIGEVIHKTYIEVDEKGTKAAAVTGMLTKMSAAAEDVPKVYLDRPFIYMIIDNRNLLPLFIGSVLDL